MSHDHVDDPEYQKLVEELAKDCTCTPLGERPCAGYWLVAFVTICIWKRTIPNWDSTMTNYDFIPRIR